MTSVLLLGIEYRVEVRARLLRRFWWWLTNKLLGWLTVRGENIDYRVPIRYRRRRGEVPLPYPVVLSREQYARLKARFDGEGECDVRVWGFVVVPGPWLEERPVLCRLERMEVEGP